jgi:hypothetical protein
MFTQLEPLDRERHKSLRLGTTDMSFARDLGTVPLAPSEIIPASRCYPIVFPLDSTVPNALLSLRNTGNLFVTKDGAWRDGAYVPAHVRRYPFILADSKDGNAPVLVDRACPALSETEGRPLFTETGEPTEMTQGVLRFLTQFRDEMTTGIALMDKLAQAGLLVQRRLDVTFADGRKHGVDGLRTIDPEKLRDLPAETVVEWHKSGLLSLAHALLASQGNSSRLAELDARHPAQAA